MRITKSFISYDKNIEIDKSIINLCVIKKKGAFGRYISYGVNVKLNNGKTIMLGDGVSELNSNIIYNATRVWLGLKIDVGAVNDIKSKWLLQSEELAKRYS